MARRRDEMRFRPPHRLRHCHPQRGYAFQAPRHDSVNSPKKLSPMHALPSHRLPCTPPLRLASAQPCAQACMARAAHACLAHSRAIYARTPIGDSFSDGAEPAAGENQRVHLGFNRIITTIATHIAFFQYQTFILLVTLFELSCCRHACAPARLLSAMKEEQRLLHKRK